MAGSGIFKQLMKEYDMERVRAARLYEKRLGELYEKQPRVGEIDRELAATGLNATKLILLNPDEREKAIADLQQKTDVLQAERAALLKKAKIKDAFFDVYKCNICKDAGFVGNERCKCLQQRLIEKYYEMSNLGKVLEKENGDAFDLSYYSDAVDPKTGISPRVNMEKNWKHCLDFIKNFDTVFDNLLLYGETGLGKTFLCNCIAKDLLDRGKTVIYVTAPQLFKKLEDIRFNRDEHDEPEQYLDMILTADLLIMDDLGSEFSSLVTSTELFNIVNTRLLNRKSTIVSTNLTPNHFEEQYTDRITSRLLGNYRLMRLFGDDIRLIKKYRNS